MRKIDIKIIIQKTLFHFTLIFLLHEIFKVNVRRVRDAYNRQAQFSFSLLSSKEKRTLSSINKSILRRF